MKLRYRISIWVALALAGSLLWGGSVWLWLAGICAGKFLFRLLLTIVLAIAVYILTYALIIGATLVTHFLNRQIYEKKKQDNRTAMQILRSGQHLRVYGIGLPKRKHISLWGTVQGTQSARQKGVYHLSLFRGQPHTYPRNHFSNNLNT